MNKVGINYLNLPRESLYDLRPFCKTLGDSVVIHANLEPGEQIPSRRQILQWLWCMEVQDLLVDVVIWTLENEGWLGHCRLRLRAEPQSRSVKLGAMKWRGNVDQASSYAAARALPEICRRLTPSFVDKHTCDIQQAVISAMNASGWSPSRATQVLGELAAPSNPAEGAAWLGRHLREFEAETLRQRTKQACLPHEPRRL